MSIGKSFGIGAFLMFVLYAVLIIGEIKCIIKFVNCDFKAPYKAEAIYGVSIITGIGAVVGYIDISDVPETPAQTVAPAK